MDSNLENHTQETKKERGMAKHPPFLVTIIQKIENVENLSFQQFQQVFNKEINKKNWPLTNFQQFNKFLTKLSTRKKVINMRINAKN